MDLSHPGCYAVANNVLQHLDDQSLANCRLVNAAWNDIVSNFFKSILYRTRVLSRQTGLKIKTNVDLKTLEQLLAKLEPKSRSGLTSFHVAASEGDFPLCQLIIENVEDKNPSDLILNGQWSCTPLHLAALYSQNLICQLIIENVGDKNPKCIDGFTPLHIAAL